jgi:DNA-binding transcriptional MerR regulator
MEQKAEIRVTAAPADASGVSPEAQVLGIGAVERDTGLSKDTLRVWERRYGFPNPERDAFGERAYPREQVEKLRAIKRLMDSGHRPGKIMQFSLDELKSLSHEGDVKSGRGELPATLAHYIDLVREHQIEGLRRALGQEVVKSGLGRFVSEVVAPLNVAIGDLWMQGALEVFEEHLYTESLQVVLRNAIANVPQSPSAPRVLLTTFPNEQHGLGLLMAEAMLVLEGAHCTSLGVETPVWDIVLGANSQAADIVALSFSLAYPAAQAVDGLAELRRSLPAHIEIWAGGGSETLGRRLPDGVLSMNSIVTVQEAVARWRARRAS